MKCLCFLGWDCGGLIIAIQCTFLFELGVMVLRMFAYSSCDFELHWMMFDLNSSFTGNGKVVYKPAHIQLVYFMTEKIPIEFGLMVLIVLDPHAHRPLLSISLF